MSQERDVTRLVRSWIREDQHESADRILGVVLDRLDTTPQRRSWWPARRSNRMNTYAKLIVAAAAVLVVAFAGFQLLPRSGGVGGEPTIEPSPSPSVLARGNFRAKGAPVELFATGDGDNVTGTMTVLDDVGGTMFAVDLQCAQTAEDGRVLIAGDTTEANAEWVKEGDFTAIVIKPGSPGHAVFGFGEDAASATTCMAYLEGIVDQQFATAIGDGALEPIEGNVELAP
jgi:hypothetical protein